jgi:hypothetical protein
MQFQRGAGYIFLLGDGDEIAEMAQFHFLKHNLNLCSGKKHDISTNRKPQA